MPAIQSASWAPGLMRFGFGFELFFRELADQRPWQLVAEFDFRGHLDFGDQGLEEFHDFLRCRLLVWAQLYERLRRLAAVLIGNTDDRDFLHRGMLIDR